MTCSVMSGAGRRSGSCLGAELWMRVVDWRTLPSFVPIFPTGVSFVRGIQMPSNEDEFSPTSTSLRPARGWTRGRQGLAGCQTLWPVLGLARLFLHHFKGLGEGFCLKAADSDPGRKVGWGLSCSFPKLVVKQRGWAWLVQTHLPLVSPGFCFVCLVSATPFSSLACLTWYDASPSI